MGRYVLSIDQGTTGTTALLIDCDGAIAGRATSEFPQVYPRPGWVEHDAEDIWRVSMRVIEQALRAAAADPHEIHAIGVTNQRETTVVWDRRTGRPIHNAIVWQCRRTAPLCEELKREGWEENVRRKTGLVIDAYFSGTKIAWLLDNVDGARELARQGDLAFGTIDTWLLYKLTGGAVHATDYTNASRTMLYNIVDRCWDDELLNRLHVPRSLLPEIFRSSGLFGHTAPDLFDGATIPIGGIAGDQQAALFGQGCWRPGQGKNTYGTGCFLLVNTGERCPRSERGLLTTLACDAEGGPAFALEGAVFTAGAAVQWLRDGLGLIDSATESEALARSVPDTGGVYMAPGFVGLGAPYWDSEARGAILGLTRGTERTHIVRATLESIAYQTRDVVEIMNEESATPLSALKVDGGAARNDFLMQFQADMLAIPVDRPAIIETTALGAALLAGLGTGFWDSSSQIADLRVSDRRFTPAMSDEDRERLYRGWKAAVSRTLTCG